MTSETTGPVEPAKGSTPGAGAFWGRHLLTPAAIIITGVMISGTIGWSNRQFLDVARLAQHPSAPAGGSTAAAPPTPAPAADIAKVNLEGEPFIGDPKAPVVMAYWFDYQCPYCRREEEDVLPQLIKDYVDTGKVRIVYKDFAILGADSQTAAIAGRAVWEVAPAKFREWHKAMFDAQGAENSGWAAEDKIVALTKTIPGVDAAKVDALAASRAADYNNAINADGSEGNAQGVGGTPSFLIGKQMIVGAQPYPSLKAVIDQALSVR
jgi:protein-disulfide isomerase